MGKHREESRCVWYCCCPDDCKSYASATANGKERTSSLRAGDRLRYVLVRKHL
jgi:hypothetical protein